MRVVLRCLQPIARRSRCTPSRRVAGLPITTHVSTDAQTQTIPRVPAADMPGVSAAHIAAPHAETDKSTSDAGTESQDETAAAVPAAESAAPSRDQAAEKEAVQHAYEAGMARLKAIHGGWRAAMAEFGQGHPDSDLGEAAA